VQGGAPLEAQVCAREEAVDLHYCSASEEEEDYLTDKAPKATGFPEEEANARRKVGGEDGRQLRSVVVKPAAHRVSYKDALVGVRTFRPRFNDADEAEGGWSVERRKAHRRQSTVWDRL